MTTENVCAVICNWNKVEDLLACVESVRKSNYPHFDLVVVDNGSDQKQLIEIKKRLHPSVLLIENPNNLGGAGGFNRGIQYALDKRIYDSIWLLDNDILVDPACLSELTKELRNCKNNGIVGSMILRMDSPDVLQELGAYIDQKEFTRNPHLQNYPVGNVDSKAISVDYVAACSLLVDSAKLKKVGLMDEAYFLYFDDSDWCLRFKHAGYAVRATPLAKVWHKAGGANKASGVPRYYYWRNMIHSFLHNMNPETDMDLYIDQFLLGKVFTALFISLKVGKIHAFKTLLQAVIDSFSGIRGKVKGDKVFILDESKFGRYFTDTIQEMMLIPGTGDKSDFVQAFIKAQKNLQHPITYYDSHQDIYPKTIVVCCGHILNRPNPHEEALHGLLSERGDNVYFIDPYENLVKGFDEMRNIRKEYYDLLHLLKVDFRSEIKKILTENIRNPL